MNFKDETKVIQLWHAPGASKKFGGSVASPDDVKMLSKISKNTDYLISSSKKIENYYAEAFQIDKSKIKAWSFPFSTSAIPSSNSEDGFPSQA